MGRIFTILLMAVAIWYGVDYFSAGMGDDTPAGAPAEEAPRDASRRDPADSSHRVPITQRVHDRVTGAMEEGARRRAGVR